MLNIIIRGHVITGRLILSLDCSSGPEDLLGRKEMNFIYHFDLYFVESILLGGIDFSIGLFFFFPPMPLSHGISSNH